MASNNIRDIIVDLGNNVWVATDGGGVSYFDYDSRRWRFYTSANSQLLSNNAKALAVDKYGRVWVSTDGSVSYFSDDQWHLYASIGALDFTFGIPCTQCPYDDDHIWLATSKGLAHGRLPPSTPAVAIKEVSYPAVVEPGETFSPRITISVLPGNQLINYMDGLFYAEDDSTNAFGANPVWTVKKTVIQGEDYPLVDSDTPFQAPKIPGHYRSVWRV